MESVVAPDGQCGRPTLRLCPRHGVAHVLCLYSAAFVAVAFLAFIPLFIEGKSFINGIDGLSINYGTFVETGSTVRRALSSFLSGKGLSIPLYDFSMGYGSVRNWSHDPFNYISVLCNTDSCELVFNALVIVRLWLVGACVLPLASRLGLSPSGTVVSSLVYAFSGSGLNCTLQIGYLNTMILFPLLVDGALRLLGEHNPWAYIFAGGAICYVCGTYMYYVCQLLIATLVIIALVLRRATPMHWLRHFLEFIACVFVSTLMGGDRLLEIIRIGSLDRVRTVTYENPMFYSAEYYQELFSGFVGALNGGRDWFYGYGACGLLGVIALFLGKSERTSLALRVLFVLGLVFLCIPFFGSAFNGFSYVANRWVFGFALLVACIAGLQVPELLAMRTERLARAATILLIYSAVVLLLPHKEGAGVHWQLIAAWACVVFLAIRSGQMRPRILIPLCLVAIGLNWALFFSSDGSNWQKRLLYQGDANALAAAETPAGLAASVDGPTATRTDRSVSLANNVKTPGLLAHRLLDTYGIDFYSPIYNNDVDAFHRELGLAYSDLPNTYYTLDQRAGLMRLLGVGSYVAPADDAVPLPYGVGAKAAKSLKVRDGSKYKLFLEQVPGTMALVYDDVLSLESYEKLEPLQKQEALLQGVILGEDDMEGRTPIDPSLTSEEIGFSVIGASEGVEVSSGAITTHEASSCVRLELERPIKSCEAYLYVKGLSLDALSPRQRYTDAKWEKLTTSAQKKILSSEEGWSEPQQFKIAVRSNASDNVTDTIATPYFHLYGGKDTWLWNVGYFDERVDRIRITFSTPGVYSFDDFKILCQPMETYDEATRGFEAQEVKDMQLDNDAITCQVEAKAGQLLFVSVPYDTGWRATINGAQVDVLRADTAFMAVELVDGVNEVVITYHSGTTWMIIVGIVTLLACVGGWTFQTHAKRVSAQEAA